MSLLLSRRACLSHLGTVTEFILAVRAHPNGIHLGGSEHTDVRFGHVRFAVVATRHDYPLSVAPLICWVPETRRRSRVFLPAELEADRVTESDAGVDLLAVFVFNEGEVERLSTALLAGLAGPTDQFDTLARGGVGVLGVGRGRGHLVGGDVLPPLCGEWGDALVREIGPPLQFDHRVTARAGVRDRDHTRTRGPTG